MPDQPLSVLMLEDHTHYVEGLRFELGAEVILEHATEVSEALRALETNTFDAALVDLSLPPTHTVQEGIRFLEHVSNSDSLFLPMVVLTSKDLDERMLQQLLRLGVSIMHKDDRPSGAEIVSALRLAVRGYRFVSPLLTGTLGELLATDLATLADLYSEREFSIFWLLAEDGLTNQQIAYRMGLKEDAVKKGVQRIFRKVDCNSRVEATRWWFENRDELTRGRSVQGSGSNGVNAESPPPR